MHFAQPFKNRIMVVQVLSSLGSGQLARRMLEIEIIKSLR